MNEEKQIEELTAVIANMPNSVDCIVAEAEYLYDAGYRRQSDIVAEFADRLKEVPIKCKLPLLGLSSRSEVEEYFNDIMMQVRDAIDKIAKEMQ